MKTKWAGLAAVIVAVAAILAYKLSISQRTQAAVTSTVPRVLLVADLREADSPHDRCAEIIHLVRETGARGIAVRELNSDSKSELLARYHVLVAPTVLILNRDGQVLSRFQGEEPATVRALQDRLSQLR